MSLKDHQGAVWADQQFLRMPRPPTHVEPSPSIWRAIWAWFTARQVQARGE